MSIFLSQSKTFPLSFFAAFDIGAKQKCAQKNSYKWMYKKIHCTSGVNIFCNFLYRYFVWNEYS